MKEFLTMFKLYSVRVILAIALLNSAVAAIPDMPWWAVFIINACGVFAHHYARRVPQPEVSAKLEALRLNARDGM